MIYRMTDTGWANQDISYIPETLGDLYQEVRALVRVNYPEWNDDSLADGGNVLLWIAAQLQKLATDHTNRAALNCYIETCFQRYDMQRLLALIGYELGSATPAAATVTFTIEAGHPQFTIPAGTQVGTEETPESDQVIFETLAGKLVLATDDTVDIVCNHGETVSQEKLGSSDGSIDQRFMLSRPSALKDSEAVEVDDSGWTEWAKVVDFINSDSDDKHYRVETDSNGYSYIVFGDGTNGAIPATGSNNVRCTYRVGGGTAGNVGAGKIIELISNVDYIDSVTNAAIASGGTAEESLAHAHKFGPPSLRVLGRAVTTEDFEYLTETFYSPEYGGIAKARAIPVSVSVQLRIIPKAGGAPSQGIKDALLDYFDDIKPVCTPLEVLDPAYVPIDITTAIYIYDGYNRDTVVSAVIAAINNHLSPVYQDENGLYPHEFGADVRLSDLYRLIDQIEGVDYCDITLPAANVSVDAHEIASKGTLNITAWQGGESQEYLNV